MGGKGLCRMGQGNTKTYLKQLFEDINNGCSEYGRDMVKQLPEHMLDREVWRDTVKEISFAQKNKRQTNSNTNTSTITTITTTIAKMRGRPLDKELYRVLIFHQLRALLSEELGSRI
jgi:hypothetical protein